MSFFVRAYSDDTGFREEQEEEKKTAKQIFLCVPFHQGKRCCPRKTGVNARETASV